MFLLRARLLHAVNAVNNFVLTTVITFLVTPGRFDRLALVSFGW